jgi:hypothetical protein
MVTKLQAHNIETLGLPKGIKNLLSWGHCIFVQMGLFVQCIVTPTHVTINPVVENNFLASIIIVEAYSIVDNFTKLASNNFIVQVWTKALSASLKM